METWRIIKSLTLGALLEVTIPKPGNVNRFRDFHDLTFYHFLFADVWIVDILYEAVKTGYLIKRGRLNLNEARIGELIRRAVQNSRQVQNHNPNFGIITLQVPLAIALGHSGDIKEAREVVKRLIDESTVNDTIGLYKAIRIVNPKGIPGGVKYDVYKEKVFDELFRDRINLKRLAEISCKRELIFKEWLNGYELSYKTFLRLLELTKEYPLEEATIWTFLELLSENMDTLIIRKAGEEEAKLVKEKAKEVLKGKLKLEEFDKFLREKGDLRNPGSLADIIAIALGLLLLKGYTLNP